jgi:hypothetical protein
MNFASLARIRVVSGTAEALMQLTRLELGRQKYPGLVEGGFYRLPDKPQELLFLAMWGSLSALRGFEECFEKRPYREELKRQMEVIDHQVYRLVKDYRTVSATIGASHLRLTTFTTCQPQAQLKEVSQLLAKFRAMVDKRECVGSWLGYLLEETVPDNRLSILIRYDYNSLESQRASQNLPWVKEVRAYLHSKASTQQFASLDVNGLLPAVATPEPDTLVALPGPGSQLNLKPIKPPAKQTKSG